MCICLSKPPRILERIWCGSLHRLVGLSMSYDQASAVPSWIFFLLPPVNPPNQSLVLKPFPITRSAPGLCPFQGSGSPHPGLSCHTLSLMGTLWALSCPQYRWSVTWTSVVWDWIEHPRLTLHRLLESCQSSAFQIWVIDNMRSQGS